MTADSFRKVLLLLLSCLFCSSAHAESKSIIVTSGRPVAKAVEQLETIYGVAITYEDPVYVHDSEIRDVTAQVRRDGKSFPKVLVPRGDTFSFTYDVPDIGAPEGTSISAQSLLNEKALDGIGNVLHSFAARRNAEMFKVIQDNGSFHVVPTRFVNASGQLEQIHPLLDTTITILPSQRSAFDLLNEMCQSLSLTTGQNIAVGVIPLNLFVRHTTTITASNETARSVLIRLLKEMSAPVPLSWQLFYGPGPADNSYALNIHGVVLSKQNE